jgi:putative transposase
MDFASWKDRKALAAALKDIYRATDATAAEAALTAFEASFWGQLRVSVIPGQRFQ